MPIEPLKSATTNWSHLLANLKLDETTDISKITLLLVYVTHIYTENIDKELLFCRSLAERIRRENIGFRASDKDAGNDHGTFAHCLIHRETFAVEKQQHNLNMCFKTLSKTHALNGCIF